MLNGDNPTADVDPGQQALAAASRGVKLEIQSRTRVVLQQKMTLYSSTAWRLAASRMASLARKKMRQPLNTEGSLEGVDAHASA